MAIRHWTWHFSADPQSVWQILADTARFNEAAGFPKHRIEEVPQADGTVVYTGKTKIMGMELSWLDLPLEWVAGKRFVHCNEFLNGPIHRICVSLDLSSESGDDDQTPGCRADYHLEVMPRNWMGRLLLPRLMRGADRRYRRLVAGIQEYFANRRPYPYDAKPLERHEDERLVHAAAKLRDQGHEAGLVDRLVDYIRSEQEVVLGHMRPIALARQWHTPERKMVELFLGGVDAGMLNMQWDILCPRCRGAKITTAGLDSLPQQGHCPSCSIDFERDFSGNVELTFHPAQAIRDVPAGEFCLFSPMSTPHVRLQQSLEPGEDRTLQGSLIPGAYRLRTLHPWGNPLDIEVGEGGTPEISVTDEGTETGAIAPPDTIRIANRSGRKQVIIIEDRAWVSEALTADRVTAMQLFRDLFPGQVLRRGDKVGVQRAVLMFTDIRGSTALYNQIGDASAYAVVREHFAILAAAIRSHNGGIVKTLGDAVMASFSAPSDALDAAIAVQRAVSDFNNKTGQEPITVKLGLHQGPAIVVTLNERLDYFGTTVNLAARLENESEGGDIVLSAAFADDPEVTESVRRLGSVSGQALLRGFDTPVEFRRISREAISE